MAETTIQQLRDAIDHVTACTGDPNAWRRGLTPEDLSTITNSMIDPSTVTGLLAKIRANNPTLFDAGTGALITPPTPRSEPTTGQRGDAASAIKKAEAELAQQNSVAAQLDLHVISAILGAHAQSVEGGERLGRLQQEVEDAVRARSDLDTPSGARDFQRFLIGKLRQIGAVVESAGLDDVSKAALASAWTALYQTAAGGGDAAVDASAPSVRPTASSADTGPVPGEPPLSDLLPVYGADIESDPMLDSPLAQPYPTSTEPVAQPAATAAPTAATPQPMFSTAPPGTGLTAPSLPLGSTWPAATDTAGIAGRPSERTRFDDAVLPDIPIDPDYRLEDDGSSEWPEELAAAAEDPEGGHAPEPEPPAPESTTVRLPDGGYVTAPTPELAEVLRSTLAGTPIVEAFRHEGITVPPPGTAVPHPLDPKLVVGGDIGMFSDRQALAVDPTRAYLDGRIEPVASVGGPSFLGWLHPPGHSADSSPAPPVTPAPGAPPPPTRPATAVRTTGA